RHTRFSRDWSSDVCSSDLGVALAEGIAVRRVPLCLRVGNQIGDRRADAGNGADEDADDGAAEDDRGVFEGELQPSEDAGEADLRSEERRVGRRVGTAGADW